MDINTFADASELPILLQQGPPPGQTTNRSCCRVIGSLETERRSKVEIHTLNEGIVRVRVKCVRDVYTMTYLYVILFLKHILIRMHNNVFGAR